MSVPPDAARPAAEFWETLFAQGASNSYSTVEMPPADDPVLLAALQSFGALDGKRLLDIGCGSGRASLFFASHGARVTSVDLSANAIANLVFCYVFSNRFNYSCDFMTRNHREHSAAPLIKCTMNIRVTDTAKLNIN